MRHAFDGDGANRGMFSRAYSSMSAFPHPASSSGLRTPSSLSALIPGRKSERSSAFVPSQSVPRDSSRHMRANSENIPRLHR